MSTTPDNVLRRLGPPGFLLLAILAAVGGAHLALGIHRADLEARLAELRAALQRTQADSERVIEEERFVAENIARYEAIVAAGFRAPQDRLDMAERIKALKSVHDVGAVEYRIHPQTTLEQEQGVADGQRVVVTPVEIDAWATFDRSVIAFFDDVLRAVPGQVAPTDLSFKRYASPGGASEQDASPLFAAGRLRFEWRSLQAAPGESTR